MLQEALKEALKHVLIIIAIAMVTIVSMPIEKAYASTLEPTSDQKIEYRAISQEIVNGKKQLIIEVRIRKLNFKGIDLDKLKVESTGLNINMTIDLNTIIKNINSKNK